MGLCGRTGRLGEPVAFLQGPGCAGAGVGGSGTVGVCMLPEQRVASGTPPATAGPVSLRPPSHSDGRTETVTDGVAHKPGIPAPQPFTACGSPALSSSAERAALNSVAET